MKPIWLSKTFWAAVVTTLLGALQSFTDFLPADYLGPVVIVIGLLNAILRYLTDQPVTLVQPRRIR